MAIYLYTGEGAGKTTNGLGLALRSIGHRHSVVIIQFLKWWKKTGEYLFGQGFEEIKKYYSIYQFGREGWHGFKNLTPEDKKLALGGLEFVEEIIGRQKIDLLILDEINLAVHLKLLDVKKVIAVLKKIQRLNKGMDIVLIGRHAPRALVAFADFANEVSIMKKPKEEVTKEGIQY